jgi:hypothetical protein
MEPGLLATDRLDLLKLFVRIAETGHISEAARSLSISTVGEPMFEAFGSDTGYAPRSAIGARAEPDL